MIETWKNFSFNLTVRLIVSTKLEAELLILNGSPAGIYLQKMAKLLNIKSQKSHEVRSMTSFHRTSWQLNCNVGQINSMRINLYS